MKFRVDRSNGMAKSFTGKGRSDRSPAKDDRVRYLLNRDIWPGI